MFGERSRHPSLASWTFFSGQRQSYGRSKSNSSHSTPNAGRLPGLAGTLCNQAYLSRQLAEPTLVRIVLLVANSHYFASAQEPPGLSVLQPIE